VTTQLRVSRPLAAGLRDADDANPLLNDLNPPNSLALLIREPTTWR
jgi:hypothetical protein